MINITFYKFVQLSELKLLREEILNCACCNNLKGKILIAYEGISGYITGEFEGIQKFQNFLQKKKEFKDMWFKENPTLRHNSKRMIVKIKKEIITFKKNCDMKLKGDEITPCELDLMYEKKEDFVLIDTRNNYEHALGYFKNAIKLNTNSFSEFPKEIMKIKKKILGKKIISYCTGGVRCEKSTAWLKKNGFENVFQLKGGIINYGIEKGQGNFEGLCFVFDNRGAIKINPTEQKEWKNKCNTCFIPENKKRKCLNCKSDFIQCKNCLKLLKKCCSKFCRNKMNIDKEKTKKTLLPGFEPESTA